MHLTFRYCPLCRAELAEDEQQYRSCTSSSCSYVQYSNPTPVVAAVVEYGEGQILLAHNVHWPPKLFALITGFLEKHEHPDEAVIREVKEELGLDSEIVSLIGHYTFKKLNQLIIAYHVKADGQITLQLDELDEYKLIPFAKLRTWPSGTGYALRDFLRSKGYDPKEVNWST